VTVKAERKRHGRLYATSASEIDNPTPTFVPRWLSYDTVAWIVTITR